MSYLFFIIFYLQIHPVNVQFWNDIFDFENDGDSVEENNDKYTESEIIKELNSLFHNPESDITGMHYSFRYINTPSFS